MSENDSESPALDATTSQDAASSAKPATDVPPGIPAEIVGNTNDLVSRDWTGEAGETPEEVVEFEHDHEHGHQD
ncbi:MAG TPA: hypothetical protein VGX23_26085 [Actinocrinis sp.]|nr:hypothetical protein [Actinocrinis sp.]